MRTVLIDGTVRKVVGAETVAELQEGPFPRRGDCDVCGEKIFIDDGEPAAVIVQEIDGDATGMQGFRISVSHPSCEPSHVRPGLYSGPIGGSEHRSQGFDAQAWCSTLGLGEDPRFVISELMPIIAFDTYEPVDMWVSQWLREGLTLVADPVSKQPVAPGWVFDLRHGCTTVEITSPSGQQAWSGELPEQPPGWLGAVTTSGRVRLLVSGTDMRHEHPTVGLLEAGAAGRLAGGTLAVSVNGRPRVST